MRQVLLPTTLEELWESLERYPFAGLYAGGTDLLVKMREGSIKENLICVERIETLKSVQDHGEEMFVGAATTHGKLIDSPLIKQSFPVLAKAASVIGSPPVRHMGTIGGNIVTASPAGDTLPALYALSAEVELRTRETSRRLAIQDFVLGPGAVDLKIGEIVAGVWLPKNQPWNISHYEKIGKRKAMACAIASMAAVLELNDAGTVKQAKLAWGSVGPTVVMSDEVENELTGRELTLETLKRAGTILDEAVSPIDDVRASADYRRIVSKALLLRLNEYART
jgi:CO/xanthine dehydrogenase FAD-binding subunit